MRHLLTPLLCFALIGCSRTSDQAVLTSSQKEAIRVEVEQAMRDAYDLSKADAADRMISLYPKTGRVVSANSGRASESRDSLESAIRSFWNAVGVNMREPKWVWDRFYVDVLAPNAAVVTGLYRIPHRNPRNEPHVLGGAMTAVFEKRDGRWVIVQEHLSDLPQIQDSSSSTMPPH
jgi:ketosteroid isomerase-like protein